MPIELAAAVLLEEEARLPGKVNCAHLPGPSNRFCTDCGALIIAHELFACPDGHLQMVTPGRNGAVTLWCAGCDGFRSFAA